MEDSDTFVAVTGDKSGNKRIVVYSLSDAYAAYNSTKEASDSRTVTVYSLYYTESYENLITWYEVIIRISRCSTYGAWMTEWNIRKGCHKFFKYTASCRRRA